MEKDSNNRSNKTANDDDEASAKSILSQIFRCEARDTSPDNVDRAVALLQKFPNLSKRTYLTKRHPSARVPLFILAERGATLEQIQNIRRLKKLCGGDDDADDNDEITITNAEINQLGSSRLYVKPELMKIMEGGKASLNVLTYLVEEYPTLLQQRDSLNRYPVHKFLQRIVYGFYDDTVPGTTNHHRSIILLNDLALKMITKFPKAIDLDIFKLALQASSVRLNDEIIDSMVQEILKQQQTSNNNNNNLQQQQVFHFRGSLTGSTVELRDAKAISQILPNLQEFSFHSAASPSPEAFCHLMDSIATTANSLQKFSVAINSGYMMLRDGAQQKTSSEAFKRALMTTSSLEDVSLHVTPTERLHHHDCEELKVFTDGITSRSTPLLKSVKIVVSQIQIRSVQPLIALLSSPVCPKSVRIKGGSWEHLSSQEDMPTATTTTTNGSSNESSLESLELVGCTMKDRAAMEVILREAVRCPLLQQFKVLDTINAFSSKMMEDIVNLLSAGAQNLKEVELTNREGIQYSSIARLLRSNNVGLRRICFTSPSSRRRSLNHNQDTTVEEEEDSSGDCIIKILEDDNTTLESLQCIGYDAFNKRDEPLLLERIGYFLHLNRNGRKRTRDIDLKRPEFVNMLLKARDDDEANRAVTEKHPGALSIIFGLLREDPALWVSTESSCLKRRRRRRASLMQQDSNKQLPPAGVHPLDDPSRVQPIRPPTKKTKKA